MPAPISMSLVRWAFSMVLSDWSPTHFTSMRKIFFEHAPASSCASVVYTSSNGLPPLGQHREFGAPVQGGGVNATRSGDLHADGLATIFGGIGTADAAGIVARIPPSVLSGSA